MCEFIVEIFTYLYGFGFGLDSKGVDGIFFELGTRHRKIKGPVVFNK